MAGAFLCASDCLLSLPFPCRCYSLFARQCQFNIFIDKCGDPFEKPITLTGVSKTRREAAINLPLRCTYPLSARTSFAFVSSAENVHDPTRLIYSMRLISRYRKGDSFIPKGIARSSKQWFNQDNRRTNTKALLLQEARLSRKKSKTDRWRFFA